MYVITRLLLVVLMLGAATEAHAVSSFGQPVQALTGAGANTQAVPNCGSGACYNSSTGQIGFHIPLNSADNGIYGVTNHPGGKSGTFADSVFAPFTNNNALTMYLRFSPVAAPPLASAVLSFRFTDLDLIGGNDPAGFFETVKFFSSTGTLLADVDALSDSASSPFAFTVSGNSTSQNITFSDVRSIVSNPFYVQLTFGSRSTDRGLFTNTLESLTATLTTTTAVPEPSSLLLFGTGVAAIAVAGRRLDRR